jgi:hypothetical protein
MRYQQLALKGRGGAKRNRAFTCIQFHYVVCYQIYYFLLTISLPAAAALEPPTRPHVPPAMPIRTSSEVADRTYTLIRALHTLKGREREVVRIFREVKQASILHRYVHVVRVQRKEAVFVHISR